MGGRDMLGSWRGLWILFRFGEGSKREVDFGGLVLR